MNLPTVGGKVQPDEIPGPPNVVLTPHAGFYSEESLVETKRKVSERVLADLTGNGA